MTRRKRALDGLDEDIRYACRTLRKNPAFATVVILTLGFGIGINTATFSIVNAALIRPLGFAQSERLVALHERLAGFDFDGAPFSPPDFLDLERDQQSFDGVAAYLNEFVELSGSGEPVRIDAAKVSANLFPLLGVTPLLGRGFTADEDRPGADVAILGWGLWQTKYGGDPTIIGKTVTLDRRPYTVVGVMPATFEFPLRGPQFNNTPASVRTFHNALFTRASSWPGVRSAALVTDLPLERYERRTLSAEGATVTGGAPLNTNLSWVYGPYFRTLGIRLKSGRVFSQVETIEPRQVVIINERLAHTLWPGQDAVGKRLRWGLDAPQNRNPWLTIVGVIEDVADGPLGVEPFRHAYEPFSQFPDLVLNNIPSTFGRHVKLAVRTDDDPRALASAARAAIRDIDSQLAIESIATMANLVSDVVAPRRFGAMTLSAFAAGALLLAAIGLYGLLVFTVRERRREIAVRLALGAEPPTILRMVVGQGLKLVSIGLVVGVVVSYGIGRAISSLLYRTEGHDVVTFGTVSIVLVLIAVIALPAYRASRVEPMAVLRTE